MAAIEHEPGKYVAKPVIVKVDGKTHNVCPCRPAAKSTSAALKKQLGAQKAELADEKEIGEIFDDCELGAEPPFGNLYDLPVIIDKMLASDDHIVFQAGTHDHAIRLSMKRLPKACRTDSYGFQLPHDLQRHEFQIFSIRNCPVIICSTTMSIFCAC